MQPISSNDVALGPVTALQGGFDVWGRLARVWRDLASLVLSLVLVWSRRTRPGMVSGPRCVSAREACANPVSVAELTTAMGQKRTSSSQVPTVLSACTSQRLTAAWGRSMRHYYRSASLAEWGTPECRITMATAYRVLDSFPPE